MPNVNIVLTTGPGPDVQRRQSTRITQAQIVLKRKKKYIADTIKKLLGKLLPLRNELSRLNDEVDLRYNRHNEDRERLHSLRQRIYQEYIKNQQEVLSTNNKAIEDKSSSLLIADIMNID